MWPDFFIGEHLLLFEFCQSKQHGVWPGPMQLAGHGNLVSHSRLSRLLINLLLAFEEADGVRMARGLFSASDQP
ncbi:hypothetical protein ALP05_200064 [Pseudomonas caricapapayae]|uniref:Uncharacterized protein n=1 Tax=Pseudomonas caricapapayae TaxID=46678 RepID=A0A3M6ERW2_9PSED|nr:hypothetical protein ALP05_200064 [Pseudomonas caricapapayae]